MEVKNTFVRPCGSLQNSARPFAAVSLKDCKKILKELTINDKDNQFNSNYCTIQIICKYMENRITV